MDAKIIEELMGKITYTKRSNDEVLLKLRKYVDYEECPLSEVDSNYLEIMKMNFDISAEASKEPLDIFAFRIKNTDKNRYLNTENDDNTDVILSERVSQTMVSTNDKVQTIILILQGLSSELNLTESEIDNAYKIYFEGLSRNDWE